MILEEYDADSVLLRSQNEDENLFLRAIRDVIRDGGKLIAIDVDGDKEEFNFDGDEKFK